MGIKKKIAERIREIQVQKAFEEGRLSVVNEQGKDVDLAKSIGSTIRTQAALIGAFQELLAE
ncbi:hypothetical protein [Hymenobacter tenuis]